MENNKTKMKKSVLSIIILLGVAATYAMQPIKELPLAFPTAEGFGKYTIGGRGGKVYEVTTLEDSGQGSLREAVEASGRRTIVFRVSGTITLKKQLSIYNPHITIAGQTAPGDGICLRGYPLSINADEVIIRYIRVRLGDETKTESDAISSRFHKNIILDHVSASWSVDETMSIYHCDSITVQWCIISESLYASNHTKGPHGFGGIWGSDYSTYHHNLIACHSSRNPRFAGASGFVDYRNNVVYNWGYNSCYGGGSEQSGGYKIARTDINIINNYYKPGPATSPGDVRHRIANPSWADGKCGKWYVHGNVMEGNEDVTKDNWNGGIHPNSSKFGVIDSIRRKQPWPAMPIHTQTATEAYHSVLKQAGASLHRDIVDERIINDVQTGKATYEGQAYKKQKRMLDPTAKSGIIDSQQDVGGWPILKSADAPVDSDHDGIPDDWEKKHSLNPHDANDGASTSLNGTYTNLEIYLASIAE